MRNIFLFLTVPDPLIVIGNTIQGVCPDLLALTWNHPTEIPQCITNYHLDVATENGNQNTSVTGTSTTVNILSSECCLRHTFTVTPVYAMAGPRDTSDPVSLIPAENGMMCLSVLFIVMCMQPCMGVCGHWWLSGMQPREEADCRFVI